MAPPPRPLDGGDEDGDDDVAVETGPEFLTCTLCAHIIPPVAVVALSSAVRVVTYSKLEEHPKMDSSRLGG